MTICLNTSKKEALLYSHKFHILKTCRERFGKNSQAKLLEKLTRCLIHCKADDVDKFLESITKVSLQYAEYLEKNWTTLIENWHRTSRRGIYSAYNTSNNAEALIRTFRGRNL